jgi:hypothetical protein
LGRAVSVCQIGMSLRARSFGLESSSRSASFGCSGRRVSSDGEGHVGCFLEVDPVKGGSANDYGYSAADLVDHFDLAGTFYDGDGVGR